MYTSLPYPACRRSCLLSLLLCANCLKMNVVLRSCNVNNMITIYALFFHFCKVFLALFCYVCQCFFLSLQSMAVCANTHIAVSLLYVWVRLLISVCFAFLCERTMSIFVCVCGVLLTIACFLAHTCSLSADFLFIEGCLLNNWYLCMFSTFTFRTKNCNAYY